MMSQLQQQQSTATAMSTTDKNHSSTSTSVDSSTLSLFRQILDVFSHYKMQHEQREESMRRFFALLPTCSLELQLQALDWLSHVIERRAELLTGNKDILSLLIERITHLQVKYQEFASADERPLNALLSRLFWLLSVVGSESINVDELTRLFRLFQHAIDFRECTTISGLLLSAICDMCYAHDGKARQRALTFSAQELPAAKQTKSDVRHSPQLAPMPTSFFDFQGPHPVIVIPIMQEWPAPKAYTISMWINWNHDPHNFNAQQQQRRSSGTDGGASSLVDANAISAHEMLNPLVSFFGGSRRAAQSAAINARTAAAARPGLVPSFVYLYSFLSQKERGIEACIEQHTCKLHLRSASKTGMIELNTGVEISCQRWQLVTIVHRPKQNILSRSHGTVTVLLDDRICFEDEFAFPLLNESLLSNALGANVTNSRPFSAFNGRMGSFYLFNRALTHAQVSVLASRGSDLPMQSLEVSAASSLFVRSLKYVLRPMNTVLDAVSQAASGSSSPGDRIENDLEASTSHLEWFRSSLLLLYHPRGVEHGVKVHDLSFDFTHARTNLMGTLAPGVEARHVHNVKDVLHCLIGGVRVLLPIFWNIEALSSSALSSNLALAVRALIALLRDNNSNQQEMIQCNGLSMLGFILSQAKQVPAHHLNQRTIASIEELLHYTCSLLLSQRPEEKRSPSSSVSASSTPSTLQTKLSPHALAFSATLPLSAALENNLFNQVFTELLFNFAIWNRSSYTEQLMLAGLCRASVTRNPRYFRRIVAPGIIFDRLRRYLSYEDSIQTIMNRDIRDKEKDSHATTSSKTATSQSASQAGSPSNSTIHPFSFIAATNPSPSVISPSSSSFSHDAVSQIAVRLRQVRTLRAEWLAIVLELLLCDLSARVFELNLSALVAMCCDLSDSLQIAELMELLSSLIAAAPDRAQGVLQRSGGAALFTCILQRHAHHVHLQVACFHLLSALWRVEAPAHELAANFHSIAQCVLSEPLTLPAYHALMELMLALPAGSLGVKHGAEFAIDFQHRLHADDPASSPSNFVAASEASAYFTPSSRDTESDARNFCLITPPVTSVFALVTFSCQTIKFPQVLSLLFDWCAGGSAKLSESLRRDSTERPTFPVSSASSSSPSSVTASSSVSSLSESSGVSSPVLPNVSHITRLVPAVPFQQLLIDLETLLSAAPSQCAIILVRWPSWSKALIPHLDFYKASLKLPTSVSSSSPSVFNSSSSSKVKSLDLDAFTNANHEGSLPSNLLFRPVSSVVVAPTAIADDVFADLINAPQSRSLPAVDPQRAASCLSLLETLLYHAVVHVRDGWQQWRDALLHLRDAALAAGVPEAELRATRRALFLNLLQRVSAATQQGGDLLATGGVSETLRANLVHLIDVLEEIVYIHNEQSSMGSMNGSSDREAAASESRSRDEPDAWTLLQLEEETRSGLSLPNARSPLDPSPSSSSISPSPLQSRGLHSSPALDSSLSSFSSASPSPWDPSLSSTDVAQLRFLHQDWPLIAELLACLTSLSFSLTPQRHLTTSGAAVTSTTATQELAGIRVGGPLRPVLRILLDCVASFVLELKESADELPALGMGPSLNVLIPVLDPSSRQLLSMLNSLRLIAARELSFTPVSASVSSSSSSSTSLASTHWDRTTERTWRNRYVLLVLSRLAALTRAAPEAVKSSLLSTSRDLVDTLAPFAVVSSLAFTPSSSLNAAAPAAVEGHELQSERAVYVPLSITSSGQIEVDMAFSLQSSTAFEPPVTNADSGRSLGASPVFPTTRSFMHASHAPSPRSQHAQMFPVSQRVQRACLAYVAASVRMFSASESRSASEVLALTQRAQAQLALRTRVQRDNDRTLSAELLLAASHHLATLQYEEAKRKASEDAKWREYQREVSEQWRRVLWQLQVPGSPWLPHSMLERRSYWQIDATEEASMQGRFRRRLKEFHEGTDLRQSTQSFIDAEARKQARNAVRASPSASNALRSMRMNVASDASPSSSLSPPPAEDTGEHLAVDALGDVSLRKAQLMLLESQLSHTQPIKNSASEEQSDAVQSSTLSDADDLELKSPSSAADEDDEEDEVKEDRIEQAEDSNEEDWDLLTEANELNRASPSSQTPNPNSYTSPSVLLVLPFTTVAGSLEVGARYFQFVPNLNVELPATVDRDRTGHVSGNSSSRSESRRLWSLPGLDASRKSARRTRLWKASSVLAVQRRRYQLQKTAVEMFTSDGRAVFFDCGSKQERRALLERIVRLQLPHFQRVYSQRAWDVITRTKLTTRWQRREITNFEYLMQLNTLSGRTYNDLNQYPIFPWVLTYYPNKGEERPDLNLLHVLADGSHPQAELVFRDLSKPIGALDSDRFEQILERYRAMVADHEHAQQQDAHSPEDAALPAYHYGSHMSNAGIVMYFLTRCEPYASLHVEFQAGKFDFADRLFHSIGQTWTTCMHSLSCFKELTPEFFYMPEFLQNVNQFELGVKQDGSTVDDVQLPAWAPDAAEFVRIHRLALESDYVSAHLHQWIDLIFGFKQKGKAAADAHNLFFHLTYEGSVDIAAIADPVLQTAVKDQIALFGQTPMQLFRKPHPQRGPRPQARARSPPQHPLMHNGLLFAVPPAKLSAMPDRSDVIFVQCCPSGKWITVSASFLVAAHSWQPLQPEEVMVERRSDGLVKRMSTPFTQALVAMERPIKLEPLMPQQIALDAEARLLFEVNSWDDSLRVYSVHTTINQSSNSDARKSVLTVSLVQHLRKHKARIHCVACSQNVLITGSADCTLLAWKIETQAPSSKIAGLINDRQLLLNKEPTQWLRGHNAPVMLCDARAELDVCLSASVDGLVLLHSISKGKSLLRIHVPTVVQLRAQASESITEEQVEAEAGLVRGVGYADIRPAQEMVLKRLHHSCLRISAGGQLIFASHQPGGVEAQLSVCSINGRNWRAIALQDPISALSLSTDGKLLACGSQSGHLCVRRIHDLRIVQAFKQCSFAIVTLAFTQPEEDYLIVSSKAGGDLITYQLLL